MKWSNENIWNKKQKKQENSFLFSLHSNESNEEFFFSFSLVANFFHFPLKVNAYMIAFNFIFSVRQYAKRRCRLEEKKKHNVVVCFFFRLSHHLTLKAGMEDCLRASMQSTEIDIKQTIEQDHKYVAYQISSTCSSDSHSHNVEAEKKKKKNIVKSNSIIFYFFNLCKSHFWSCQRRLLMDIITVAETTISRKKHHHQIGLSRRRKQKMRLFFPSVTMNCQTL